MSLREIIPGAYGPVMKLLTVALAIGWCGPGYADDVSLISGSTFKSATGSHVRGQVQSESPSEVVVLLGATNTSVPTDQIQSIRYDGQSANIPWRRLVKRADN